MYVYIDSLFLLNFILNYILCLSVARLSGLQVARRRIALTAAMGAAFCALVFLARLPLGLGFVANVGMTFAMALLLFGFSRGLVRLVLLFFMVSAGFAGFFMLLQNLFHDFLMYRNGVLYFDMDLGLLLFSFATSYFMISVVFGKAASHSIKQELIHVEVSFLDKTAHFSALIDSGNELIDPLSGKHVMVIEPVVLAQLLPPSLSFLCLELTDNNSHEMLEKLFALGYGTCFRLLSYQALGKDDGLLLGFLPQRVLLNGKEKALCLGISPKKISNGAYKALVGVLS